MEKTIKEKKEDILNFMKEAFCIDGEARLVEKHDFKIMLAIELNDSKRGKFYIGALNKLTN